MHEHVRSITYRWLSATWPMVIVGLLVGAGAGGLVAQLAQDPPTATALIRVDQPIDPDQIVTDNDPTLETQPTFLAGEIVYLSSSGFAKSVGDELKSPSPPALTAEQQGQSNIVRLTTTDATTHGATAALDVAIKTYAGRLEQLSSERTQGAIDANTSVIVRVRSETDSDAADRHAPVDQHALDDKLRTLEQQRLSLQSQLLRPPSTQVVEPISAQTPTIDRSLPITGGTLLGGLLALAGTLAWRTRSGVITSATHLERLVSLVLRPVVGLGAPADVPAGLDTARTLYGQLLAPRTGKIVVMGASKYSGTDVVTRLLYEGARERVSVTTVNLDGERTDLASAEVRAKLAAVQSADEQTVIIDGGSVASSPHGLEAAERAQQIVVVARIGRDVATDVETLLRAITELRVPVTAICTKGRFVARDGSFGAARREASLQRPEPRGDQVLSPGNANGPAHPHPPS